MAFTLNIAFATSQTVCDANCDFESLKEAMVQVNNTEISIIINSPGEHSINSSVYQINTTDKAIHINSSNVLLDCNNSVIKGNGSGEGIYATGSNITLQNCHLKNFPSRGFRGENLYNSSIKNTRIEKITGTNGKGILLNTADNNSIINSYINGSDSDIETSGEGFGNYIINSTFEKEKLKPQDGSELIIKWYVNVHVTGDENNIKDATVNITSPNDDLVSSFKTNEEGKTQKKPIPEYRKYDDNGINEENLSTYWIFATNSTHYDAKEIELTSSTTVEAELTKTSPVIENIEESTTNETVKISFETDKEANSFIEFAKVGLNKELYEFNESTTTHGKTIENLEDETKYTYKIKACDEFNFCSEKGPFNFTTNATREFIPPEISLIKPKEDNTTVYDRWLNQELRLETNEPSTCQISQISGEIENTGSLYNSKLRKSNNNKTHNIMFNATDDGNDFFIEFNCADNYGNEKSKQVSFSVNDTTKPYVSFMGKTIDNREYTNKENITIYIKSEEGLRSGYPLINLNEEENNSMNHQGNNEYNYTFSELDEGRHTIYVYARDEKGNLRERSRTFTTDYTPPEMKINMPGVNYTFEDTNIMEANLTIDKEDVECEYELFYLEQEELDECVDECEEDYDDCIDDADTNDEEDECEEDLDECTSDCKEDKYSEEEDDEIELYMDIDDCQDKCDNIEDRCKIECKDEQESCFDLYTDKSICYDNHEDCVDNCEDNNDDCHDDCEDMDFTYFKSFDKHFKDGGYLFKFECQDRAGNKAKKNSTFLVEDTTPPKILQTSPNGTVTEEPVDLTIQTDELSICRYSKNDVSFEEMNNSFGKISMYHTKELEDLQQGEHTYYISCNDTNANVMEENEEISFELILEDKEDKEDKTLFSKIINKISAGNKTVVELKEEKFSLQKISIITNEDAEDIEIKIEEMKEQDIVEKPQNEVYKYFTISKIGLENEQIEKINLSFRVKNNWLDDNKIERLTLKHYTDSWNEEKTTKENSDSDYTYYKAEFSGLSMFSIIGEKEEESEEPEENETREAELPEEEPGEPEENQTQEPETDQPEEIEPISFDISWIWILIVSVLVVGGGTAAFFVYRPNRHPQQDLKDAAVQEQPTLTQAAAEKPVAASFSQEDKQLEENKKMESGEKKQTDDAKEAINEEEKKDPLIKYVLECSEAGQKTDEIINLLMEEGYNPIDAQETLIKAGLIKDEVKEYITKAIEAGQNEDYIKGALLRNGFAEEYIERKIDETKGEYVETHFKKNAEEKQKQKEDKLKKSLENYVRNAIETGMTNEDVKKVLLDMGHSFKDVDKAIGKIEEEPKNKNVSNNENKPQTSNENEVDRELIEYVKQCMDSKLSKYHIKKILKDAGYEKQEIKEALDIAEKEKK